jgi:hypothetical protein
MKAEGEPPPLAGGARRANDKWEAVGGWMKAVLIHPSSFRLHP